MSYFAPRFIDENYVFLSKVKYLGEAGDASVFLVTQIVPVVGDRKVFSTKILTKRGHRCHEFPISSEWKIEFKHFLKMKNTLC